MEERTVSYLKARFRDYYRHTDLTEPPKSINREWGIIPWTADDDAPMFRHKSVLEYGSMSEMLVETSPCHAYFSAARYDAPSEETMSDKGWKGADLVFDLDADHLPGVGEDDTVANRLETCKQELLLLLDFLERDFGFENMNVVFSGGRGYHVHVRSDDVLDLDGDARSDIVDYVRGHNLTYGDVTVEATEVNDDLPSGPARTLSTWGGWGRRVHETVIDECRRLADMERADALESLQEYDGIAEKNAEKIMSYIENNRDTIESEIFSPKGPVKRYVKKLIPKAVDEWSAAIDDPVTHDVHRLIRIPGSIHGGTGLKVTRLDRDEIDAFKPLVDAVPEEFRTGTITVETTETDEVGFDGETHQIQAGERVELEEHLAVYLMCRGLARKP